MSGPASPAPDIDAADHDRRRVRGARRLALVGVALGVVGAAAVGLAGLPGGLGLAALLAGAAVGCVLAAIHLATFALVDELRRRPVSHGRPLRALGFFVAATLLLVLIAGASRSAT